MLMLPFGVLWAEAKPEQMIECEIDNLIMMVDGERKDIDFKVCPQILAVFCFEK